MPQYRQQGGLLEGCVELYTRLHSWQRQGGLPLQASRVAAHLGMLTVTPCACPSQHTGLSCMQAVLHDMNRLKPGRDKVCLTSGCTTCMDANSGKPAGGSHLEVDRHGAR